MFAYFKKRKARMLHDKAQVFSHEGKDNEALDLYYKALECDEKRPTTHYNIGLIYKYRGVWDQSFDHNLRAHELNPTDEAALWNLGIAATALRRWKEARDAWIKYGVKMEAGVMPPEMDFGMSPVRVYGPEGEAEVVWGRRIDPARTKIISVPYPDSGFRYGDLVLNDGAPNGSRVVDGQEYSVFDVLELITASEYSTFSVTVKAECMEDVEELDEFAEQEGVVLEDWTQNVRHICRACSEGKVHEDHDEHEVESEEWVHERSIGVAALEEDKVHKVLDRWMVGGEREVIGVECRLPAERH